MFHVWASIPLWAKTLKKVKKPRKNKEGREIRTGRTPNHKEARIIGEATKITADETVVINRGKILKYKDVIPFHDCDLMRIYQNKNPWSGTMGFYIIGTKVRFLTSQSDQFSDINIFHVPSGNAILHSLGCCRCCPFIVVDVLI